MKRITLLVLTLVILLSNFTSLVNAAVIYNENEEERVETCRVLIHPVTLDQYTDAKFETMSVARKYFGMDRTYYSTYEYYAGSYYNKYYYFADGTKQYFYVIYDDEVDMSAEENEATYE